MRIAKLFIKGMRAPLELTEAQGIHAKSIKENIAILDSATVDIGEVWTGDKADMRYIIFETIAEYKDSNRFSNQELRDFEEELKPYFLKEEDDEFKKLVDDLVEDIKNAKKLFYSVDTKAKILAIRELHLKEEDIIEKAKEIIRKGYIGTITKKGEMKYLVDKQVIKMNEDGRDFSVIQLDDKTVPYNDMNNKLSEYNDYKGRVSYAKKMDTKHLEEMAEQVGVIEEHEM